MKNILVLAGIVLLSACGSSTKLVSSWKDKDQPINHYEKIGIAVLYPNESSRYLIERAVEKEFKAKNINAMATYEVWPLAGRIGENPQVFKDSDALKAKIKAKVAEQNMDAVMFITLVNVDRKERYVNDNNFYHMGPGYYGAPAAVGYFGSPYGAYYNYYAYSAGTIYDTGYYVEDVSYYIDCKLFDAKNETLLWAGETKTVKLTSVEEEAVKFAQIIVNDITGKKVLVP